MCDFNLLLQRQQCFLSDDGEDWKTLKEGIVGVVGFDLRLKRLVGIYQTDFNGDNQVGLGCCDGPGRHSTLIFVLLICFLRLTF